MSAKFMSTIVKDLKQNLSAISQHEIDTVCGYVRDMESWLSQHECIPSIIVHIILAFYWVNEYFASCSKWIKISDNGTTITDIGKKFSSRNTSYCNQWISSMNKVIVKWNFHLSSTITRHYVRKTIQIGFVSKKGSEEQRFGNTDDTPNYSYDVATGIILVNGKYADYTISNHLKLIKPGDTFEIILNLIKKEALVKKINVDKDNNKNNNKSYVIFRDIEVAENIHYKLAVSLLVNGYKLKLNEFGFVADDANYSDIVAVTGVDTQIIRRDRGYWAIQNYLDDTSEDSSSD